MSAHLYRDLPLTTPFIGDAVAIDPDDCGCTDCILGDAIHPSTPEGNQLAAEHMARPATEARRVINRTSQTLFAVARRRDLPEDQNTDYPMNDLRRCFDFYLSAEQPEPDELAIIRPIPKHC